MSRVLVPLATGCEELEAITIIDLLRRGRIEVVTAGLDDQPVVASRGTVIIPDTTLDAVATEAFDMIALPGGLPGADHLRDDPRVIRIIQSQAEQDKLNAAICAAPKVLAAAGLLENRTATGYPGVLEALDLKTTELTDAAVEVDGKLITSRGPGTAMDFALTLIEQLEGKELRDSVEAGLVRPAA